jgi:hypothetical protein
MNLFDNHTHCNTDALDMVHTGAHDNAHMSGVDCGIHVGDASAVIVAHMVMVGIPDVVA